MRVQGHEIQVATSICPTLVNVEMELLSFGAQDRAEQNRWRVGERLPNGISYRRVPANKLDGWYRSGFTSFGRRLYGRQRAERLPLTIFGRATPFSWRFVSGIE
jgi:hypothetical protein